MDPLVIGIVAGVVAIGGAGYWFLRPRAAKEEVVLYFNCRACGRKLKYRPHQAGHKGQCPSCRKDLVFPKATATAKK